MAVLHQHYHWPGIKADVAAYVEQCHACQVKRLELQQVAKIRTPRMSGPFRHVHIDLAGPFALRQVKAQPVKGRVGRTKATLSTERTGQACICLMVEYFTKAAEFAPIPDKKVLTLWLVLSTTTGSCDMVCLNGWPQIMGLSLLVPSGIRQSVLVSTMSKPLRIIHSPTVQSSSSCAQ